MTRPRSLLDPQLLARLAEGQSAVEPSPEVTARLKARIIGSLRSEASACPGDEPRPRRETNGTAPTLTLTLRAGEGKWVQVGPKVELKVLRQDAESRSILLRLQPGAVLPPHDHPLDEECYVLEGEVRFGDLCVRAGDFHLAPKGVPHGLVRSRTGALLLLRGANTGQCTGQFVT